MVSDTIYELCQPILKDSSLEEEDKTDKLEELLRKETALVGRPLEDAILGVLWRFRDSKLPPTASPPVQNSVLRRGSPAPWQIPRASTPMTSPSLAGASPASSYGLYTAPPNFARAKSSTASPFSSPRPSPRLAFTSPIPHSPNLNQYEFSEPSTNQADYGDYGSDTVDWLVNDDSFSRPTSSGASSAFESNLSGAAAAWIQPQQTEMSPYDMLRSVLGESRTDEEIDVALESNNYDLSATIVALMGNQGTYDEQTGGSTNEGQVLIGKPMGPSQPIQMGQSPTPAKSNVICKYWMTTGNCLRADCRFSHEFGTTICRYWLMGNCLAGDTCVFSHDPANLVSNLNIGSGQSTSETGPNGQPSFQVQDYDAFPVLQSAAMNQWAQNQTNGYPYSGGNVGRNMGNGGFGGSNTSLINPSSPRSYGSRPTSRHSSRAPTPSIPPVDDTDAFPTLGSANVKIMKKYHGKRGGHGHNHGSKENNVPNSLADVIRMSPSPAPGLLRKGLMKSRSYVGRDNSAAANAIAPPEDIPWLETGEKSNKAYLKARQDAFKHGGLRNKFLQNAAQAWNRNDARAAKALSLRGQSENDLMRKAHREAARILYEERNSKDSASNASTELYVDLHGLHPEEAIEYLDHALLEHATSSRPLYAITGTGHHSKNGKDKVSKAVRAWLIEWRYAFREFSVPGDRGNVGGILGIDARSAERGDERGKGKAGEAAEGKGDAEKAKEGVAVDTKVRVAKEIPTGPRSKS